jgi:hypothetical protein
MKKLLATLALMLALAAFASAADPAPELALRFIPADHAFQAIKKELGEDAAKAVASVDIRRNTIVFTPGHAQEGKVREFLTQLDKKPSLVP